MNKVLHPFHLGRDGSVLVLIDAQDGMMKAMEPSTKKKVIKNINLLVSLAQRLALPILVTEQYPRGLGKTIPELQEALGDDYHPIEKVSFSCCGEQAFNAKLKESNAKWVVLAGVESHVCVLQTALDLLAGSYTVHVASDAVCSRSRLDWEVGLRLMEKAGAVISSTEILIFELLVEAGTDEFKAMSKLLK